MILLLLCFRKHLGVSLGSIDFGIALGFGLFAATNMLIMGIARVAGQYHTALSQINVFAYLAASLIWLAYARRGCTQLRAPDRADAFA